MDLDRIITLVVVIIIWLVSNGIRKVAKPEPQGQELVAKQPGFFQILQQNLAALEERSRGEDDIALDEYLQPAPQPEPESLIDLAEKSMVVEESVSPSAPLETVTPRGGIIQKKPGRSKRSKLQRAIIWSEILAPPVALRDQ